MNRYVDKFIKGHCVTNLDDFDCTQVTVFAEIPKNGDSMLVLYHGIKTTLQVCNITHTMKKIKRTEGNTSDPVHEPYIIVELTK
jgi:hypothetical protein